MIDFITSKFNPTHHPIERYNIKHREEYDRGLGELLSFFMPNNQKAKVALEMINRKLSNVNIEDIWINNATVRIPSYVKDINDELFYDYLHNRGHLEHVDFKISGLDAFKRATSLKREGFKFFRMVDSFWWDFYRICNLSKFPIETSSNTHVLEKLIKKSSRKFVNDAKSWFYSNGNGDLLPPELKQIVYDETRFKENGFIRVLVVGTMSSGKSTLINALIGHRVAKVKATVCTSSVTNFCNRPDRDFVIYGDDNTCIVSDHIENALSDSPMIGLNFEGGLNNKPIIFIDTPGINYAYDKRHKELTEKEIRSKSYDAIICVVNSGYMESDESKSLVGMVAKVRGKKKIFVLNQFDRFDPDDDSIEESINHFKSVLKELKTKAEVIPFSAKAALLFKKADNGDTLSKVENAEMNEYKRKMDQPFYDLGSYYYSTPSRENDYYARTGLTYLETIIVTQ